MSFMKEQMPDFSKASGTSEDMINQILSSYTPSAALNTQEGHLENQMRNQDFDSGLSGSTLEAQNIGSGVTQAEDKDQEQYLHDVLGVEPQVLGAQTAVSQANKSLPFQLAGDVGGLVMGTSNPISKMLGGGKSMTAPAATPMMGAAPSSPFTNVGGGQSAGGSGYLQMLLSNPQLLAKMMGGL